MVPPSHPVPHRSHEEDRPLIASASRTDPQLFPGSETALQRRDRGAEQQIQSHDAKILRIPHLPHTRTGSLSITWQAARARIHQRILLTNGTKRAVTTRYLCRLSTTGRPIRRATRKSARTVAPRTTSKS